MAPAEAISALARTGVSKDVAVELLDPDFDGALFHIATRVDELSDILFARHCDFHFSCVSVVGARVGGSRDRSYRGDFDAEVDKELHEVLV